MKKIIILSLLHFTAYSQSKYDDSFLRIGTSTRSISVGQAVVALPAHPQAYLYNPAGIALSDHSAFSLLAVNQFSLADYYSFSLSTPLGDKTVFGFHGIGLLIDHILERPDIHGISDLEARRDTIQTLVADGFSSFSNRETAWTFTLSRKAYGIRISTAASAARRDAGFRFCSSASCENSGSKHYYGILSILAREFSWNLLKQCITTLFLVVTATCTSD